MEKLANALTTLSSMSTSQYSPSMIKSLPEESNVRVLKRSEYKQAALCLAEAFEEDEVACYPINTPDRQHWTPQQKYKIHLHILECLVKAHIMRGVVTCIGPDYDCVALWSVSSLSSCCVDK